MTQPGKREGRRPIKVTGSPVPPVARALATLPTEIIALPSGGHMVAMRRTRRDHRRWYYLPAGLANDG